MSTNLSPVLKFVSLPFRSLALASLSVLTVTTPRLLIASVMPSLLYDLGMFLIKSLVVGVFSKPILRKGFLSLRNTS